MISLDNDPTPLLGLTDVTCCPCHVCVSLNETPMIKVLLYHIVFIAFFLHPIANLFFSASLLLSVFYTCLMRPVRFRGVQLTYLSLTP